MKYVRTKDNIYEIVNDYGSSCAVKSRGKRGKTAIDGFTIKYGLSFAQRADTIEELCDEFVLCEDNRYYCVVGDVEAREMAATNYGTIYGAIWSYKGLIYVAKMNEEGELELL